MTPGDTVIIDLPGSALHGKAVEVLEDIPEMNIAAEGSDPFYCHGVKINVDTPFGKMIVHISHISGTAEASDRRRWESELRKAEIEERQGELLL